MSFFSIPSVKSGQGLRRFTGIFFGEGVHLGNWFIICNEKRKGGLDIKSLHFFSRALLEKWSWRYASEGDAFWKQVIQDMERKETGDLALWEVGMGLGSRKLLEKGGTLSTLRFLLRLRMWGGPGFWWIDGVGRNPYTSFPSCMPKRWIKRPRKQMFGKSEGRQGTKTLVFLDI